jgi:hypothetical protein
MPRIDQDAPVGAACPEGNSMSRESSMPRVSGIKGLHIAAFNEIEDKLVSVF